MGAVGLLRPEKEDHMLLRVARAQPRGVDAALHLRHLQGDCGRPAAVGQRVLVEFDAAELGGRVAEAVLVAGPVEAGHAPHRPVDACAIEPVGARVDDGIADARRAITRGRVPSGDDRVRCRCVARLACAVERIPAQHPASDARAVDLAIVELGCERAPPGLAIPCRCPEKVGVRRRRLDGEPPAHMARALDRDDLGEVVAVAVLDRLLVERGFAARGVV